MSLRIPRELRMACAALALAAYVLPLAVGLAAQLGHGAEHVRDVLRGLERRAAAMGVAHLHDAKDDLGRATLVHAHGGAQHAHDAGVAALLVAAEEADEHAEEAGITAPVEISSHVPAAGTRSAVALMELPAASIEPLAAVRLNLLPPPLPPPRA